MSDTKIGKVPAVVKNKAKNALTCCNNHMKLAKEKLSQDEPAPWGNTFLDAFSGEAKAWSEAAALLPSQLGAIRRAA